jgi:hypothetical protein
LSSEYARARQENAAALEDIAKRGELPSASIENFDKEQEGVGVTLRRNIRETGYAGRLARREVESVEKWIEDSGVKVKIEVMLDGPLKTMTSEQRYEKVMEEPWKEIKAAVRELYFATHAS